MDKRSKALLVASLITGSLLYPLGNGFAADLTEDQQAVYDAVVAKFGKDITELQGWTRDLYIKSEAMPTPGTGKGVALGKDSIAKSESAVAIGNGANASEEEYANIAIGSAAQALGGSTVAIGSGAQSMTGGAVAIGTNVTLTDENSHGSTNSIGIGHSIHSNGIRSILIGEDIGTTDTPNKHGYMVGIGYKVNPSYDSVAIGSFSSTKGSGVAIGAGSHALADNGVAIGFTSFSASPNSVALGHNSYAYTDKVAAKSYLSNEDFSAENGVVAIGNNFELNLGDEKAPINHRRITGVAGGADEYDAVNVKQLQALSLDVDTRIANKMSTTSGSGVEYIDISSNEDGNKDNSGATGTDSIAIGPNATAKSTNTVAIGSKVTAATDNAIVIGSNITDGNGVVIGVSSAATSDHSIAIGVEADASGSARNTAVGWKSKATGDYSVAYGQNSQALGESSVALGTSVTANGKAGIAIGNAAVSNTKTKTESSIAIGDRATAESNAGVAIGIRTTGSGDRSTALGFFATSSGKNATALGANTEATASSSVAIGSSAKAEAERSVAIGSSSVADRAAGTFGYSPESGTFADEGEVIVYLGKVDEYNELTTKALAKQEEMLQKKAAADANPSDNALYKAAVQARNELYAILDERDQLSRAYKAGLGAVSVGNDVKTRQITNVAAGTEDTDAVNVAQLKALNNKVEKVAEGPSGYVHVNTTGQDLEPVKRNFGLYNAPAGAGAPESVAIGSEVTVSKGALRGVAIGRLTNVANEDGIAIGHGTNSIGDRSVALGFDSTAGDTDAVVIGPRSNATGLNSLAVGNNNTSAAAFSYTFGQGNETTGQLGLAMGYGNKAKGLQSIAIGVVSEAGELGEAALAIGTMAKALGKSTVALGSLTSSGGNHSVTLGYSSITAASAVNGTALGRNTYIGAVRDTDPEVGIPDNSVVVVDSDKVVPEGKEQMNSIAIGHAAKSFGYQALSVGNGAETYDTNTIAIGVHAKAKDHYATAIGKQAYAEGEHAIALGHWTRTTGENSVAIGTNSIIRSLDGTSDVNRSVTLGSYSRAASDNSVALGSNSLAYITDDVKTKSYLSDETFAKEDGVVSVGNAEYTIGDTTVEANRRRITNVAGGADDYDAVNVKQLTTLNTDITNKINNINKSISDGKIQYVSIKSTEAENKDNSGAQSDHAIAIGPKAAVIPGEPVPGKEYGPSSQHGVAIGYNSKVIGSMSGVAIGPENEVNNSNTGIIVGRQTKVINSKQSAAFGYKIEINNSGYSLALGERANIKSANNSIAIGYRANIDKGNYAITMGSDASVKADYGVGLGALTSVTVANGVALGAKSEAVTEGKVLGYNPLTGSQFTSLDEVAKVVGLSDQYNGLKAQRDTMATTVATQQAEYDRLNAIYEQDPTNKVARDAKNAAGDKLDASMVQLNNIDATINHIVSAFVSTDGAVSVGRDASQKGKKINSEVTRQITHVAAGTEMTDAVNVAQLKQVESLVNNHTAIKVNDVAPVAGADGAYGEYVNTNGLAVAVKDLEGQKIYDFKLSKDITIGTPGKDGKDGTPGSITIIGEKGKDGADGTPGKNVIAEITVKEGRPGVDGKDGETITRIVYEIGEKDENGNPIVTEVATLNDGMKFAGDDNTKYVAKKLNEQLDIKGGAAADALSENNIGVVADVDSKDPSKVTGLRVKLAKNLALADGSVAFDEAAIDADGNSLVKGQDGNWYTDLTDAVYDETTKSYTKDNAALTPVEKPNVGIVKLSATGLDNGNQRITNVAAGTANTDAVNYGQLKDLNTEINTKIDNINTSISAETEYVSIKSNLNGNKDSKGASGTDSIAIGPNASTGSTAKESIAIGKGSTATIEGAVVIGRNITNGQGVVIGSGSGSSSANSVAIGLGAIAGDSNQADVAIGSTAKALGYSVAIGNGANAYEYDTSSGYRGLGVAIGSSAGVSGQSGVAIGSSAKAGLEASAIGGEAKALGETSIAIGQKTESEYYGAISLGNRAKAQQDYAMALGYYAEANAAGSVAIGSESVSDRTAGQYGYFDGQTFADDKALLTYVGKLDEYNAAVQLVAEKEADMLAKKELYESDRTNLDNKKAYNDARRALQASVLDRDALVSAYKSVAGAVSVGKYGITRQITNVAAGTEDTDAVNVAQLKSSQTRYFAVNSTDNGDGSNYNNDAAIGKNSMAIGANAGVAKYNENSIALGYNAKVNGSAKNTVVIGPNSNVNGTISGVVVGSNNAVNQSTGSVVVGSDSEIDNATASVIIGQSISTVGKANWSTIIANDTTVTESEKAISIGKSGEVTNSKDSIKIGTNSKVIDSQNGIALGFNAFVTEAKNGIGMGFDSRVNAQSGIALGTVSKVTVTEGVALGAGSLADTRARSGYNPLTNKNFASNSEAIAAEVGKTAALDSLKQKLAAAQADKTTKKAASDAAKAAYNQDKTAEKKAAADKAWDEYIEAGKKITSIEQDINAVTSPYKSSTGAVSVGKAGLTRQITNVAAGTDDTDAVNVAQLKMLRETGLNLKGDSTDVLHRGLSEQLNIIGGANASELTNGNIGVVASGTDTLTVKLAKNVALADGSVAFDEAVTDGAGNKLVKGQDGNWYTDLTDAVYDETTKSYTKDNAALAPVEKPNVGTVKLSATGLDNGNQRITHVAAGTADTDAVNYGQLNDIISDTSKAIGGKHTAIKVNDVAPVAGANGAYGEYVDTNGLSVAVKDVEGQKIYDFKLSNDIIVGTPGKDGKDGTPGSITIVGEKGKDGADGTPGKNATAEITVKEGTPGVDGKDGETITRIVYETGEKDENGNPIVTEVATLNDGMKFAGDDSTKYVAKKLNEQLDIKGGAAADALSDNNIGVVADVDSKDPNKVTGLRVKLAKDINLPDGSVRIGGTTDEEGKPAGGLYIANQKPTPKVAGEDAPDKAVEGLYITGLSNTDWDPDKTGIVENRAATEKQLLAVANTSAKIDASNLSDDNVASWKDKLGIDDTVLGEAGAWKLQVNDKGERSIKKNSIINFKDGDKIKVTQSGSDITIGVDSDFVKQVTDNTSNITNLTSRVTKVEGDIKTIGGKVTNLEEKVNNITNNGIVTKVEGDATTGVKVTPVDETDATKGVKVSLDEKITVGGIVIDGTTAKDGEPANNTIKGLTNKTWDGKTFESGRAATEDQLHAVDGKITNIMDNISNIAGATTIKEGDGNIKAVKTKDKNEYTLSLNKDLKVENSISVGGNEYITKDGINANNQVITNVGEAKLEAGSKNAATVNQVVEVRDQLTEQIGGVANVVQNNARQISRLDSKINKAGAGAAALAALHPLDFDPDNKWNFTAGVGTYHGSSSLAVGAFYRPNEETMFSIGGAVGNGEDMMNIGVSLKFGDSNPYAGMSRGRLIEYVEQQTSEIDALKAQNESQNERIQKLEELVQSLMTH